MAELFVLVKILCEQLIEVRVHAKSTVLGLQGASLFIHHQLGLAMK